MGVSRVEGLAGVACGALVVALGCHGTYTFDTGGFPTPTPSPAPTGLPSACPSPIFSGDFETGDTSQWSAGGGGGLDFTQAGATAAVVTTPVESGTDSLQLTTPNGGAYFLYRSAELLSNDALFFRGWYYFPTGTASTGLYWELMAWEVNQTNRMPLADVCLAGSNGELFASFFDHGNNTPYPQHAVPIPHDTWFRIDAYYRCSRTGAPDGRFTLWQDGALLLDLARIPTGANDLPCLWDFGALVNTVTPNPAITYVDDAAISTNCGAP